MIHGKSLGLSLGFVAVVALSSCDAKHTDVSADPKHRLWVGRQCTVLKGLQAHGFTRDLNRRDVTDEVDVTTFGISGPEVTFTIGIPKGTSFLVTSVRECWNCPFDKITYGVEFPDVRRLAGLKVFARPEAVAAEEAQCAEKQIR